jgi:formylglycine-generating enzyme required for sulfatase activity
VVLLGESLRQPASHCRTGFSTQGARCCPPGTTVSAEGTCEGTPTSCPEGFQLLESPAVGCALPNDKVKIEGGELTIGPTDWDTREITEVERTRIVPFLLDRLEVTVSSYEKCREAGVCEGGARYREPGLPVTYVTAGQAEAYCKFAGGHLPSTAQWTFAAMGEEARRFPWGAHGLVCRRSVYGTTDGPCANGALTPQIGGMRPAGATPEGLLDLSGNVAEWTIDERGQAEVKGGSFRSKLAADLKGIGRGAPGPADDVGFRCAYPIVGIEDALSH